MRNGSRIREGTTMRVAGRSYGGSAGGVRVRRSRHVANIAAGLLLIAIVVAPPAAQGVTEADLAIRATATSFRVGSTGTYRITVTNGGGVNTDDPVRVSSTLPNGLGFVGTSGGWTCTTAVRFVQCTTATVPAATTVSLELLVRVGGAAAPSVTTTFNLEYAGDPNTANNSTTRSTSVKPGQDLPTDTPAPAPTATGTPPTPTPPAVTPTPTPAETDLLLTMLSASRFVIGSEARYLLAVSNIGVGVTNVPLLITDTLPLGLTFASSAGEGWTCTASGQTVACTFAPSLTASSSTSLTLTVRVGAEAYPSVTNIATLTYPADTDLYDNVARRPTSVQRARPIRRQTPTVPAVGATPTPTASPRPAPPASATPTATPRNAAATDLKLVKVSAGSFRVGRTATYTLTVDNIGSRATNVPVTIVDILPSTLRYSAATGTGWSCSAEGQVVTCTHPDRIAAQGGAAVSLTVTVTRAAFPSVTNEARLEYPGDTNTTNNLARRPTTVRQ